MTSHLQIKVALIDSGVGGLSILDALREQYPKFSYSYYLDRKNFPYGRKTPDEIIDISLHACQWLQHYCHHDILIVACNTASTIVLPSLRKKLNIPVIGVVPAIKPAAMLTKKKHIALMATSGTVNRGYTKDLIREFALDCQVDLWAMDELVLMAEKKVLGTPVDLKELEVIMTKIFHDDIMDPDVVVVGCTHFSHLLPELKATSPKGITFIDSIEAITKRVKQLLEANLFNDDKKTGIAGIEQSQFILSAPLNAKESSSLQGKYKDFLVIIL